MPWRAMFITLLLPGNDIKSKYPEEYSTVACENSRFPSLFAAEGRLARRNVCDSATEIPHWWRKFCPESGHKRWLDDEVVT